MNSKEIIYSVFGFTVGMTIYKWIETEDYFKTIQEALIWSAVLATYLVLHKKGFLGKLIPVLLFLMFKIYQYRIL